MLQTLMADLLGAFAVAPVLAAATGGLAGLLVVVVAQVCDPVGQRRLERTRAELLRRIERHRTALADRNSAEMARRDYEYEARMRLYASVEPLLLQLHEAVEDAYGRIKALAQADRVGRLGAGERSWMARDGDFLHGVVHRLLLPAVHFRLLQRHTRCVDLELDERIRVKYFLLKLYYHAFADDVEIAALEPVLEYQPDHPDADSLRRRNPAVHWRQGLTVGTLDAAADTAVIAESATLRAMGHGEFVDAVAGGGRSRSRLTDLVLLYRGFAPADWPVLFRLLLVQALLARLLVISFHEVPSLPELRRLVRDDDFIRGVGEDLAWEVPDAARHLAAARTYVEAQLARIPAPRVGIAPHRRTASAPV